MTGLLVCCPVLAVAKCVARVHIVLQVSDAGQASDVF